MAKVLSIGNKYNYAYCNYDNKTPLSFLIKHYIYKNWKVFGKLNIFSSHASTYKIPKQ